MFRCNFRKRFKSHSLTFFTYLILSLRFSIKLKVFDKSFRLLIEQRFNSRISRILFSNFFNIFNIFRDINSKIIQKKVGSLSLVDFSLDNSSTSINFQYQKKKVREEIELFVPFSSFLFLWTNHRVRYETLDDNYT